MLFRPILPIEFDSPLGYFKVHYDTAGVNAVYQANISTNIEGIPDYVYSMSTILDSVYQHIINLRGYPAPPNDDTLGGDSRYDIYLQDIDLYAFGFIQTDDPDLGSSQSVFSYIELDNDYQRMEAYRDRPLDAVRISAAHEYFHAVQFGMDVYESETYGSPIDGHIPRYWMEMSAEWMEEDIYDDINDYYFYLPSFFNDPRLSIQQFVSPRDLRPYGAVVFPIFLAEKFEPNIIRDIWLKCAEMGPGPHFLLATQEVVDSATSGQESFASIFSEFALWNYFTGDRASIAPLGIGYSERANYPAFPDHTFMQVGFYPTLQLFNENPYSPDHNGASYLRLKYLQNIRDYSFWVNVPRDSLGLVDTTYWICARDSCTDIDTTIAGCPIGIPLDSCCLEWICTDSSKVFGMREQYESFVIDTSWYSDSCEIRDTMGSSVIFPRLPPCETSCDPLDSTIIGYDFMHRDTVFTIYFAGDPTFPYNWGVSLVLNVAGQMDSLEIQREFLDHAAPRGDSIEIPFPQRYESAVAILTPASEFRENYHFSLYRGKPIEFGFYVGESLTYNDFETGIGEDSPLSALPGNTLLRQNYPNPFNPRTTIQFALPFAGKVRLDVINLLGQKVTTLLNERRPAGYHIVYWDGRNESGSQVASGIYFYRLQAGELIETKKMLLLK